MLKSTSLKLSTYFKDWMELYKKDAVRPITYQKYEMTLKHIRSLVPNLKLSELNRRNYQELLNTFAETHERQTCLDFHHQIKSAIRDAVEDGYIQRDPTYKVVIKGTVSRNHKPKFLNQQELTKLLAQLEFGKEVSWDYFFLLIAKTGLRFSEALGLTPNDFDFRRLSLNVTKTWDYKSENGSFAPTKNQASIRRVPLDWQVAMQFAQLVKGKPKDEPIFLADGHHAYNETANKNLERLCKKAGVPVISVHGLRHTHASLLLYAGVSIGSVARRLGHSNMNTTQKTYLHIIQELENQDTDKIMRYLTTLM
ncbi:tyrosine-type recombinase/integrase [Lactobacillus rossiae]|uniref:Tyrosine-type recombinase/integrase n=1 Tax=Furfurilactobacillus milii TaxID=2888272 RepID=A0A6N9I437_9LACO|nr:site-specific integrase [Furfurilactobacillus milii]MYV17557.1 tyrosine-type recombinase/integrase [Furfurilactobacillus milii]